MIDTRAEAYLLSRLNQVRYRAAMANAERRSWLDACPSATFRGVELVRFLPGPAVNELAAVAARLAEEGFKPDPLGLATKRIGRGGRDALPGRLRGEIEVDDPDFDEALAAAASGMDVAPMSNDPDAGTYPGDFDIEDLVRAARSLAAPIKVEELATALLLAKFVANVPGGIETILAALSGPRPVVAVISPVVGFADTLRHLIMTGVVLPYGAREVQEADTRFQSSLSRTRGANPLAMTELRAGHGDGVRERSISLAEMAAALRAETPILVQAPSLDALPQRLTDATTLILEIGSLDFTVLSRMIQILRGTAPSAKMDDRDCAALSLLDLSIAMRPGLSPDDIVGSLKRYAAESREGEDAPVDKGSKNRDIRPGSSRGGKPASALTILHPSPDPKAPRVETLAGYGQARQWALDLAADIEEWRAGAIGWEAMSPRLLLSGAPGTGKTVWAKALGNSLNLPVLVTSAADWIAAGHLGDVLTAMDRVFAEARRHAPCILFIDEADGIGRRDGAKRGYDDFWISIVNKALELMDGAVRTEGVVLLAATNRPEALDPALRRSGRLETHIVIPRPDHATQAAILAHHLGDDLASVLATAPSLHQHRSGADPHLAAGSRGKVGPATGARPSAEAGTYSAPHVSAETMS